jgi:hypothetical protein
MNVRRANSPPDIGAPESRWRCQTSEEVAKIPVVWNLSVTATSSRGVAAPLRVKMRSLRSGADGVLGIAEEFRNAFLERVPFPTTPSAPSKEASRLLLDVASTPPMSGGDLRTQFIHTTISYSLVASLIRIELCITGYTTASLK